VTIDGPTVKRIDAVLERKRRELGVTMTREHLVRSILERALQDEEARTPERG